MNNLHHPSKKEFQVERIIFFSDAVFAIAITLLIIEIKVPLLHGSDITEKNFFNQLLLLSPQFLGFILSFFLIGLYWSIHHKMFGYVINYNSKLIWLNLLFLFSIALMPFSTAVYSEYSAPENIQLVLPYAVYVANICLTGFICFLIWTYIGNPKNKIAEHIPDGDFLKTAKIRSLLLPSIFIISLLISIISPIIARFSLFLIPFFMNIFKSKNNK
ncbi:MAG: DUF1211 domain-containing protein [Chitinophagales bacterium]|nr:DUF1211 domain-containing protein [Chitinophagales bacterium]